MTELETRLLNAFKQLDQECRQRDQLLANTLADLSKRLNDGAARNANLNSQLAALSTQIERLQTALNRR
jgi:septal ring factor EnvC (AmiA/AmiB activator)